MTNYHKFYIIKLGDILRKITQLLNKPLSLYNPKP